MNKKEQKFNLNYQVKELKELTKNIDKKILAAWAIDCTLRVLPYFTKKYPKDNRPEKALETLREWIKTGVFKMSVIRKASLDSHAAAREVGEDNPARSAARAAGQAVASAHVAAHSIAAANYCLQAIYRATDLAKAYETITKERKWQYNHLLKLSKK